MSKCKFTRESALEFYRTSCTGDEVDIEDAEDWKYCPYCGHKIKLKTGGDYNKYPWQTRPVNEPGAYSWEAEQ